MVAHMSFHCCGIAQEIPKQIQRMDGLVDQYAAAFGRPGASPTAFGIIGRVTVPHDSGSGAKNFAGFTGTNQRQSFLHIFIVPVLKAYPYRCV